MQNVYLLIGTQKAGTTSLYHILRKHPQINCARRKETEFFFKEELYERGLTYYQETYFDSSKVGSPFLDVDPNFMYYDYIADRIHDSLGDEANFLLVLRDPAERTYSNYLMERARGKEHLPFEEAIIQEPKRMLTDWGRYYNSYIDRSLYFQQLSAYLRYYPLEKFQIFLFENDFIQNRSKTIDSICEFMGISKNFPREEDVKLNPRKRVRNSFLEKAYSIVRMPNRLIDWARREERVPTFLEKNILPFYKSVALTVRKAYYDFNTSQDRIESLSQEMRQELIRSYFLEDIQQLEKLIGRDLSTWKR